MRYFAKTDLRQPEIVVALRKAGASVSVTSGLGKGHPDLIVGFRGMNFLLELKSPRKVTHQKKGCHLTPDQEEWHAVWKGQIAVIETAEQALDVIGFGPSIKR